MKILTHTSTPEHARFFQKLIKALDKDYDMSFITNNLLTYIYIKLFLKEDVVILKKRSVKIDNDRSYDFNEKVFNYFYNYISEKNEWDIFLIWNGALESQKAIKKFAEENNKKILFFEISNIDNRLFVDTKGVNMKSSLYDEISILEKYNVPKEEYEKWKEKYLDYRFNSQYKIKQAVKFNYKYYLKKILKFIVNKFEKITGIVTDYDYKFSTYFKTFFSSENSEYKIENNILYKYIFFPLQVSDDTQIIYNSDTNVIEALNNAYLIAKKEKLRLVIKLHPAEQNKEILKEIIEFSEKNNIDISDKDTFELISKAEKVITINSTVGLESIILEKETEFLGYSFYKYLNQDLLKNYILGYLIDVDFFSKEEISKEKSEKILERMYV